MMRQFILVTLLFSTLGNHSFFPNTLFIKLIKVLARGVDKLDGNEENATSGDLKEIDETHEARSFPEKSAAKVYNILISF